MSTRLLITLEFDLLCPKQTKLPAKAKRRTMMFAKYRGKTKTYWRVSIIKSPLYNELSLDFITNLSDFQAVKDFVRERRNDLSEDQFEEMVQEELQDAVERFGADP